MASTNILQNQANVGSPPVINVAAQNIVNEAKLGQNNGLDKVQEINQTNNYRTDANMEGDVSNMEDSNQPKTLNTVPMANNAMPNITTAQINSMPEDEKEIKASPEKVANRDEDGRGSKSKPSIPKRQIMPKRSLRERRPRQTHTSDQISKCHI